MPNKEDEGEKNNGLIKCETLSLEDELREDEEYQKWRRKKKKSEEKEREERKQDEMKNEKERDKERKNELMKKSKNPYIAPLPLTYLRKRNGLIGILRCFWKVWGELKLKCYSWKAYPKCLSTLDTLRISSLTRKGLRRKL